MKERRGKGRSLGNSNNLGTDGKRGKGDRSILEKLELKILGTLGYLYKGNK